jgi:Domain of unknown function (DUF4145)
MGKHVEPTLGSPSFTCPHCGALAHQTWFHLFISQYDKDNGPEFPPEDQIDPSWVKKRVAGDDEEEVITYMRRIWARRVFFTELSQGEKVKIIAENLDLSNCTACDEVAIWVADKLVHPSVMADLEVNPDIPDELKPDVEEAARIIDISPKAASALLRLCVQRIIMGVAEKSASLNEAVGVLAEKGLDSQIQRALAIVRVTGSGAVSPGQIYSGDDRHTALTLFNLVNLITNAMITQPRLIGRLLENLPERSR